MNIVQKKTFNQIIRKQTIRYATIYADGIALPSTNSRIKVLTAQLIYFGEARTWYLNKKPFCRSFNGQNAFNNADKKCDSCENNQVCTPQVIIDCVENTQSMRFVLAYTSAENFLYFIQLQSIKGIEVIGKKIEISIINHNSWGEAIFNLEIA